MKMCPYCGLIFIGKPKQKYCSLRCSLLWRNKFQNPAQSIQGREKIRQFALKRDLSFLRTPEKRRKLSQSISGIGHWNWQGGKSHPNCIDCHTIISHGKTRCKKCNGVFIRGKNSPNWKGGKKIYTNTLRNRVEFKTWRNSVYSRDNYTCQICKTRNSVGNKVYLNAHHLKSFTQFPELRYDINNGITLCRNCHYRVHSKKYQHELDRLQDRCNSI